MSAKNELGFIVVMIAILILIIVLLYGCMSNNKYNEIESYDIIVIDGKEYDTNKVDSISKTTYQDGMYRIELSDGTVIVTSNYTLINKKGEQ